jgi:hypothetical protein
MVRGRVKITKIGFTMAFTNPRTAAPIKAGGAPAIAKPGTMVAVINNEAAVANQVIKNWDMGEIPEIAYFLFYGDCLDG